MPKPTEKKLKEIEDERKKQKEEDERKKKEEQEKKQQERNAKSAGEAMDLVKGFSGAGGSTPPTPQSTASGSKSGSAAGSDAGRRSTPSFVQAYQDTATRGRGDATMNLVKGMEETLQRRKEAETPAATKTITLPSVAEIRSRAVGTSSGNRGIDRLNSLLATAGDEPANAASKAALRELQETGRTTYRGKTYTLPKGTLSGEQKRLNASTANASMLVAKEAEEALDRRKAAEPKKSASAGVGLRTEHSGSGRSLPDPNSGLTATDVRNASEGLDRASGKAFGASMALGAALIARGGNPFSDSIPELQANVDRAISDSLQAQEEKKAAQVLYDSIAAEYQTQEEKRKYASLLDNRDFLAKSGGDEETARRAAATPTKALTEYYQIYHRNDGYEPEDYSDPAAAARFATMPAADRPVYYSDSPLRYINDEEAGIYFYLWNTQGAKAASAYVDTISSRLNERRAAQKNAELEAYAHDSPALASAVSVPSNAFSIAGVVDLTVQNIKRRFGGSLKPIDYNTPAQDFGKDANKIRETVAKDLEEKYPGKTLLGITNLASFAYMTGMSMADSGTQILLNTLGVPEWITLGMMAGGAAQQSIYDAKERGATDGEALAFGYAAGIAEYLFEKISLDHFVDSFVKKTGKTIGESVASKAFGETGGWFKELLRTITQGIVDSSVQGGIEASEEGFTALANTVSDIAINKGQSELFSSIQEKINAGEGHDEAVRSGVKEWAYGLLTDALGGLISGVGMGSAGNFGNVVRSSVRAGQNNQAASTNGNEIPGSEQSATPTEPADRGMTLPPIPRTVQEETERAETAPAPPLPQRTAESLTEEAENRSENPNGSRIGLPPIPKRGAQEGQIRAVEQAAQEAALQDAAAEARETSGLMLPPIPRAAESETFANPGESAGEPSNGERKPFTLPPIPKRTNTSGIELPGIRTKEDTQNGEQAQTAAAAERSFREQARELAGQNADGGERRSRLGQWLEDLRSRRSSEERLAEQRRESARLKNEAASGNLTGITGAEAGITDGSDEQTAFLMPERLMSDAQKEAVRRYAEQGTRLQFIIGQLGTTSTSRRGDPISVRAFISDNGNIYVQADHSRLSWEQLLDHEELHREIRNNPALRQKIMDALLSDKRVAPRLSEILDRYAEAYDEMGVTDENEVIDEMLADYRAGFDMLDVAGKTAVERLGDYRTKAAAREAIRGAEQEMGSEAGVETAAAAQSSRIGGRASIEPSFVNNYQQWVQDGRPGGKYINVGVTPDKFSNIGIEPRRFSWDTSKLNDIQKKHPYMSDDIVRQASQMIDNPVLILTSKTQPNSAVFFGEVYVPDENGNPVPVMAALQLTPTRNGYTIEEYKIASAYAREHRDIPSTKATQELLNSSEFLYVDPNKKRTQDWLGLTRLQLPFMPEQYGFMNKISLVSRDVNGNFSSDAGNAGLQDWQKKLADALNAMGSSSNNGNTGNRSIEIDPEEAALYRPEAIARRQAQGRKRNPFRERKVSRVRSNTYEESGLFNEVEAQMDEADPSNYEYDPISEKRSMNEARSRLKADFDGEVSRLSDADHAWGGSDLDTAMGILHRYRSEGRATGDYSDFWNWSKVIQEKGTKGGQFIQAFAKYTRTGTGQAQKAAENLRKQYALNPAQQKRVDEHKARLLNGIEEDAQDAADGALQQAKGQRQGRRKAKPGEVQRMKDAEHLIREIYGIFNRRQQNHGAPVGSWIDMTGEELAKRIASRFNTRTAPQRTTMQTILSDLVGFAEEHALPERQRAEGERRTAIDTITDYLSNRDAYGAAWAQAQAVLRAQYAQDQEKLDTLEGFLGATIAYNAEGTDRTMLDAILQSADVLGISEKRILELASAGVTENTVERIGDELVSQVRERMGEDWQEEFGQQLRDAVRRHVTGIALSESTSEQAQRLGRLETAAARELDIDLQKLLTESRLTKQDASRRVADYLIRELGIPAPDAAVAGQRIGESFMDELAARADRRLGQMFGEKTPKAREQRDKLLDLLRLGGFTNANIEDAVADALGIGKLSREEQRRITGDMARFGETLDAMMDDDLDGLRQLIREQAAVRKTPLSRQAEKVLNGETDAEYLRDFAMAQLASIAGDYAEINAGAKISTFQTISHLLNMRTALRNLTSNQVFDLVDSAANNLALVPDMVIGAFTGRRTVGVNKSWLSDMKRSGAIKGAGRNLLEVRLDVSPSERQRSKYGTAGRRTNSMANSNAFGRILSHLEEVMGYELNSTDEFHKGSVRGETLESLARLVGRGDMTQEEANAFAEEEALYRSFQDDTLAGNLMGEMKTLLNVIGFGDSGKTNSRGRPIHDFGLGDLVVKYTQVPGALIHRGIEYSPLGYAKMLYDLAVSKDSLVRTQQRGENTTAAQRRLALDIGRATTGSGLITLFAALAKAGLLRRDDDDKDKNAKALHAAQGLSGTQLNVSALGRWIKGGIPDRQDGDVLADIGFLEPLDSLMTIATLLANDKDLSVSDIGTKSLDGVWKAISNTSAMQTVSNIISTVQYHDEENDLPLYFQIPIEIASDSISGFIPSPVRQLAQATDTTYRDQYRSQNVNDQIRDKAMNAVPGLRQLLAPKITPLGEDKKYQKPLLNYLNATLNPGNINVYQASGVTDELDRVYGETGDAKIWPERNAPYSITVGDEKVTLTPDERTQYQRTRGQQTAALMKDVMESDWYKTMDATAQAEVLNWIGNFSNYLAKREMLEGRGIDYGSKTYDKYYSALMNGDSPADVVADKFGKAITTAQEIAAAEAVIAEASIPEASREEAETMSPEAKRYYAGFLQGGVSDATARNLAVKLDGSDASGHEQWREIYDNAGSEGEKAVTSIMTEDMRRNWELAKDAGVSMDDYIKVRENFQDLNGNGSKSQNEWNATLDSFTFSENEEKDKQIKGTLWQILTGSSSTKNNPYDKAAGEKVIEAKSGGGGSGGGQKDYAPARIRTLRLPEIPKANTAEARSGRTSKLRLPEIPRAGKTEVKRGGLTLPSAKIQRRNGIILPKK